MSGQAATGKGFVFADTKDTTPNKILGVAPMEAYLVNYTDGSGQSQVRIALKVKDSDAVFVLQEKIGGMNVATGVSKWFQDALNTKLNAAKTGADGAEQL